MRRAVRSRDEHEGEQAAEQAVEHDRFGKREAEPHDSLQLAPELGLAGNGLDHGAEDGADADPGADGSEADAETEGDRLPGLDVLVGGCDEVTEQGDLLWLASAPARWPCRYRWLTGRRI